MPRQQATRLVGVRIPKEHFTCIQTMAETRGQDISTVLNELIFEAMPRIQACLADQLGVRLLAFRMALGFMEPRPSPLQVKLMEYMARMIPERAADADLPEEKQQRLQRVLQVLAGPSPFRKGEDSVSDEKASEFLLQVLNLEEDLCRRLAQPNREVPGGPANSSKKYRVGEKPSPGPT